jgi:hypothetical protein
MVRRIIVICLAIIFLFTGCHFHSKQEAGWPVVNQITVTCEQNGALTRRVYTTETKMRQILNSLRSLGQKSTPAIDPGTLSVRTYCITLYHTDSSQRLYQIKGDRYIRICRDSWQQVDPEQISELHLLLQNLPSDEPSVERRMDIPRHLDLETFIHFTPLAKC